MKTPAGSIDFSDLFSQTTLTYEPRPGAEAAVVHAATRARPG